MSPEAEDPVALARRLIDANSYLTLGAGRRRRASVGFSRLVRRRRLHRAALGFLARCAPLPQPQRPPGGEHRVFDLRVPLGEAQAVYMSAVAQAGLSGAELERGIEIFSRGSQAAGARPWSLEDVVAPAGLRLYRATATETFVLDSIGDTRQGDHRIPVDL